jgi:hypothetical protein
VDEMGDLEKRKVGGMSVWRAVMFFMWMDAKQWLLDAWINMKQIHELIATGRDKDDPEFQGFGFGRFFFLHIILCIAILNTWIFITGGIATLGDVTCALTIGVFAGVIMGFISSGCTVLLDRIIKYLATSTKAKALEYKRSVMLRADAYALESGTLTLVGMEERPEVGALYVYDGSQAGDISFCTDDATDFEKERWLDVSTNHPHDVGYWAHVVECPNKIKVGDIIFDPTDGVANCIRVDSVELKTYMRMRREAEKLQLVRKYTVIQSDIDGVLSRAALTKQSTPKDLVEVLEERYVFDILVGFASDRDYSRTGEILFELGYAARGGTRHVVNIDDVKELNGKTALISQLKKSILDLAEHFLGEECGIEAGGHFSEPVLVHGGIISGEYVFKDICMGDDVPTRVDIKPFDLIHEGFEVWRVVAMHFKNIKAPDPGIYADYAEGVDPKNGDLVIVKPSYARKWGNAASTWYALKVINRPRIVKRQKSDGVSIIEDLNDEDTTSLENKYLMKIIRA